MRDDRSHGRFPGSVSHQGPNKGRFGHQTGQSPAWVHDRKCLKAREQNSFRRSSKGRVQTDSRGGTGMHQVRDTQSRHGVFFWQEQPEGTTGLIKGERADPSPFRLTPEAGSQLRFCAGSFPDNLGSIGSGFTVRIGRRAGRLQPRIRLLAQAAEASGATVAMRMTGCRG